MQEEILSELVIRLTSTDVFVEQKSESGKVISKAIRAEDLTSCISKSTFQIGIETGILPQGTVWYREEMDNSKFVVISYFNQKVDISYGKRVFKDCSMPNMLFGFKVAENGHIYSKMLTVVKDTKIRDNTELFEYPFSNVYPDFRICMGGNNLKDISELYQIEYYPYIILSAPNNDDMFDINKNTQKLSYFEILSELEGKESFDNSLLVKRQNEKHVADFIKNLKKGW